MRFNSRGSFPLCGLLLTVAMTAPLLAAPLPRLDAFSFYRIVPPNGAPYGAAGLHSNNQGYLGVDIRTIGDPVVSGYHLHETHGAVVIALDHDSPAWTAGIREHDVIYSVNGTNIQGEEQLRRTLAELQPGRTVSIVVSRDGNQQALNATLADRNEIGRRAWEQHWVVPAPADAVSESTVPAPPSHLSSHAFGQGFMSGHLLPTPFGTYTGAMLEAITPQLADFFGLKNGKGLLVHSVEPNSPAALAGLHAGDVVTQVDGRAIGNRSDWSRAVRNGKGRPIAVLVMRDRHEQTLTMMPEAKKRGALDPPANDPSQERPGGSLCYSHGKLTLVGAPG